jgi:hypothetical protein
MALLYIAVLDWTAFPERKNECGAAALQLEVQPGTVVRMFCSSSGSVAFFTSL